MNKSFILPTNTDANPPDTKNPVVLISEELWNPFQTSALSRLVPGIADKER